LSFSATFWVMGRAPHPVLVVTVIKDILMPP